MKVDPDILKSVGVGLKVLPGFVQSIETLFGKGNDADKKAAVMQLTNDAIFGAALGFGVAGDETTAALISNFAPAISDTVDTIVSSFNANKPGWDNPVAKAATA